MKSKIRILDHFIFPVGDITPQMKFLGLSFYSENVSFLLLYKPSKGLRQDARWLLMYCVILHQLSCGEDLLCRVPFAEISTFSCQ